MGKFKLTTAGRIAISVIVLAIIGGAATFAIKSGLISFEKKTASKINTSISNGSFVSSSNDDDDTIHLSLDEWAGWLSIVSANGGLTTQPGSTFDKLGLDVEINVINDATESSNALISGDLQAAGYTTNRTAFLSNKFSSAGLDIVMPVFTNYSYGGDGIIAYSDFANVESWVGARVGVPEFSEAQTLVVWFVQNSDLSEEEKTSIIDNMITFSTPDEAAKAFFAGELDVAATWEPYLTQAKTFTNSVVVFDTKSSSSLVMDGIVFNKEWAEAHRDTVELFVQAVVESYDDPIDYDAAREVFPMYEVSSDEEIAATFANAKMCSWADNKEILTETAPMIYTQMCNIWTSIGETVNYDIVSTLFDTSYLENIKGNVTKSESTKNYEFTEENKQAATNAMISGDDFASMLNKTANISFVPNAAVFADQQEAVNSLNSFIDIAKTLDGTIILISGNIYTDSPTDFGIQLSQNRAKTIANYFATQGIDPSRIVTVGSGNEKYMSDAANGTVSADKSVYQSTDISFMKIEG